MIEKEPIIESIQEHITVVNEILQNCINPISELAGKFVKTIKSGNKILLMGNGGSASDCQHIAAELVGKLHEKRRALPAIALASNPAILSAVGNDFSFDCIFERQIEALSNEGDLVIGISTSGNSINVIQGIKKAKTLSCYTVGLLGKNGGEIARIADLSIVIPSNDTARIQECHILIGHIICEILEKELQNEQP